MIFKFFGDMEAITSDETGKRLVAAIDGGAEWVEINGNRYNVKSIAAILQGNADPIHSPARISEGEKRKASSEFIQRIKEEMRKRGTYKK